MQLSSRKMTVCLPPDDGIDLTQAQGPFVFQDGSNVFLHCCRSSYTLALLDRRQKCGREAIEVCAKSQVNEKSLTRWMFHQEREAGQSKKSCPGILSLTNAASGTCTFAVLSFIITPTIFSEEGICQSGMDRRSAMVSMSRWADKMLSTGRIRL